MTDGPADLLGRALLVRPDGTYEGGLGGAAELDRAAAAAARGLLDAGRTGTVTVGPGADAYCAGRPALFVQSSVPPPRMIVFGAIDFAAALVRVGKFLGHHVTVCDARPVFATGPASRRRTRWSSTGRTAICAPREPTPARCCAC